MRTFVAGSASGPIRLWVLRFLRVLRVLRVLKLLDSLGLLGVGVKGVGLRTVCRVFTVCRV